MGNLMKFSVGVYGGLERVDVGTGQCLIRHPETNELRIVNYTPEQAAEIAKWHEARKANRASAPLIQNALPFLNADQREEILSGLPGSEFDELFKDDDSYSKGDDKEPESEPAF